MKLTVFTLVFLGVMFAAIPTANAQGPIIAAACRRNCSLTDAACIVNEQTCQAKLGLYYGYMGQLGTGVTVYQLPQLYIDLLQPHYGAFISGWRFGFSDRQPANNATTDCSRTYFNDQAFVDDLRAGNLNEDSEFTWLFHEIQHHVQCSRLGSRDLYAKMWFEQLEVTFIQNNDLATLHDRMPMEGDADGVANRVLGAMANSRGADGRLVRSITLELLRNHVAIPTGSVSYITQTPQLITARVTGFSTPPSIAWSIKQPNQVFAPATGSGSNGTELQWTPTVAGRHDIRATVNPASTTESVTRVVAFNVLAPGEQPPGTSPPQDVYEHPTLVPKLLQVRLLITVQRGGQPASAPISICVSDNDNQDVYGRALVHRGQATFTVKKNRSIKVIISGGGGFRGETRIVQMGETELRITINQQAGSTGPFCGIS